MATFRRPRSRRVTTICQLGGFALLFGVYGTLSAVGRSSTGTRVSTDNIDLGLDQLEDAKSDLGQRVQPLGPGPYSPNTRE